MVTDKSTYDALNNLIITMVALSSSSILGHDYEKQFFTHNISFDGIATYFAQ
jgi:hypothetical protein